MSFIAGGYTITYNAKTLGQLADGVRMSHQLFKRLITGDNFGDAPQDAVYRGMELFLAMRLLEWNASGVAELIWPYSSTAGTVFTNGIVGLMDVRGQGGGGAAARAKQIVLTEVAGAAAANDAESTITFPLCTLAEGYPVDVLYAPDLREVPLRMRVYPNSSTGVFGTAS